MLNDTKRSVPLCSLHLQVVTTAAHQAWDRRTANVQKASTASTVWTWLRPLAAIQGWEEYVQRGATAPAGHLSLSSVMQASTQAAQVGDPLTF